MYINTGRRLFWLFLSFYNAKHLKLFSTTDIQTEGGRNLPPSPSVSCSHTVNPLWTALAHKILILGFNSTFHLNLLNN